MTVKTITLLVADCKILFASTKDSLKKRVVQKKSQWRCLLWNTYNIVSWWFTVRMVKYDQVFQGMSQKWVKEFLIDNIL